MTTNGLIITLENHARRFRDAIDSQLPKISYISFKKFPKGSCGDASELLGKFLIEQSIANIKYVNGRHGLDCTVLPVQMAQTRLTSPELTQQ